MGATMRSEDYSRAVQGWMAGCLAATVILSGSMLFGPGTMSNGIVSFLVVAVFIAWVAILVFIVTGGLTLIPAAVVVWISERFRIRSILFFGCVGAVMGGLTVYLLQVGFTKPSKPPGLDWLYVSAGLAAGLAYWRVAGRFAGARRGDRQIEP
jgi:hypothetical protein